MAYVQPNSVIEFYSDIGISQDYNDSLYFENPATKNLYFTNLPKLGRVERCYYSRDNRGFVRVELPMSTMIHAQYMRFQNTSYENKWWYAFVKDVIYINDNTTEVEFDLDPLMTWMGDFTLSECFVERQHGATDVTGDNVVEENLNTGDYVNLNAENESLDASSSYTGLFNQHSNPENWNSNGDWVYLAFVTEPVILANPVRSGLGVYNGCSIYIFANTPAGRAQMDTQLHNADIFGNVISIILVPEAFIPRIPNYVPPIYQGAVDYSSIDRTEAPYMRNYSAVNKNFVYLGDKPPTVPGHNGYIPKNKKLYTYPYNFLAVYNSEGKEMIYKYELFRGNICNFKLTASLTQKPEIMCFPVDYRMDGYNLEEGISMTDFPMAGWSSDLFMAYVAQTLSSAAFNAVAGGAQSLLSPTSIAPTALEKELTGREKKQQEAKEARKVEETEKKINENLNAGFQALLKPVEQVTTTSNDAVTIMNHKDFYFFRRTIRPEYAEMIDNYFTMFGYAQRKVMEPQMNVRQRFTYVKTIGCKINCACPASDADFIEQLFNRGIRFWKDHTQIGNYSAPNRPLSEIQGE